MTQTLTSSEPIDISTEPLTSEQKTFFHALIPFAAHLFDDPNQRPRGFDSRLLPLQDNTIASREGLEALQDIFIRGTLKYLSLQAGWQQRFVGRLGQEKPRTLRFWDPTLWQTHPLQFTQASVDTLIVVFNLFLLHPTKKSGIARMEAQQPSPQNQKASKTESQRETQRKRRILEAQWKQLSQISLEQNGDLLAHLILYTHAQRFLPKDCAKHPAWLKNPLILLGYFHQDQRTHEDGLHVLEWLKTPQMSSLMPWCGVLLRNIWLHERSHLPYAEKYEEFLQYFEQMARVWSYAIRTFHRSERYEMLVPWFEVFSAWLKNNELTKRWPAWLQRVSYPQRMSDRQAIVDTFLQALALINQLQDAAEAARELHPVEREAPHRIFLQSYEETGFAQVIQAQKELKRTLQPTIG